MKLIAIAVAALMAAILTPNGCFAQAALVTHIAAQSSTGTVTTSPLDTSACRTHCAEFLFLTVSWGALKTPTDRNGNSWQEVPGMYIKNPGYGASDLYACYNCTVSSNQTFSAPGPGAAIAVLVFNNVAGFDKGATKLWLRSAAGRIAPTNNDEVIVTFVGGDAYPSGTPSVRSRFSVTDAVAGTRSEGSVGSAYLIQATATTESAYWSESGGNGKQQIIAAFYSTEAPGALSVTTTSLPEGFENAAYSFCFAANGGIQPYTWSQTAGNALNMYALNLNASTGCITGKPKTTVLAAPIAFQVKDSNSRTALSSKMSLTVAAAPLSITTSTCPGGIQLQAYSGCTIAAAGGTAPYTFSWDYNPSDNYASLPPGLTLNPSSGALTSSLIGAQGTYGVNFVVTDAAGAQAAKAITFGFQGRNAFLEDVFPSDSIFHHRVDAATTGLPVDTSPAAPIYSAYLTAPVRAFFGSPGIGPKQAIPNGIPVIEVPHNQATVPVSTLKWQYYFGTSGGSREACSGPCPATAPIPSYAPIESTCVYGHEPPNYNGDAHVIVYQEPATTGQNPALWEMNVAQQQNGQCGAASGSGWLDVSNAYWANTNSDGLTRGSSDAAGLPVGPLLLNADEVCGTDTTVPCVHPNGTIEHPIRFTVRHMLPYWVWPGTSAAGVGGCLDASGKHIGTYQQISQGSMGQGNSPLPVSCPKITGLAGEIYRLKASVATPSCAATSPQAAVIITALRDYGMILADNGLPALIGTPDIRWNDSDLSCIRKLTLADFEPVNVSSLKVSNDSGQTQR